MQAAKQGAPLCEHSKRTATMGFDRIGPPLRVAASGCGSRNVAPRNVCSEASRRQREPVFASATHVPRFWAPALPGEGRSAGTGVYMEIHKDSEHHPTPDHVRAADFEIGSRKTA